jgi:KDO2-lipid IV(A) lauroyltransferase
MPQANDIPAGHRLAFFAVRCHFALSGCMPPAAWLGAGRGLGSLLYLLAGKHRRIARANLRFAFGGSLQEDAIDRIIQDNVRQFGMIGQEFVRFMQPVDATAKMVDTSVTVEGEEHLLAARAKSRSVILLGAHFGNWEIGHLFYARHYNRLNFIVRRIDNPLVEQVRYGYNTALGVNILYKENGLKEAIHHLKKGEDLVIFADQNAGRREGITADFFGHPSTSLYIAPSLAQKYRVPLVPMFTVRERDPRRHRLVFLPEIPIADDHPKEDIATLVRRQNEALEQIISRYPDHWLWFHRRWKVDYPEIYR